MGSTGQKVEIGKGEEEGFAGTKHQIGWKPEKGKRGKVFVGRGLAWRQVFHRHFIGSHLAASRAT